MQSVDKPNDISVTRSLKNLLENKKFDFSFKLFKILLIRLVLITILALLTAFYICVTNLKWLYLAFIAPMFVIMLETVWIIVKRKGRDFSW